MSIYYKTDCVKKQWFGSLLHEYLQKIKKKENPQKVNFIKGLLLKEGMDQRDSLQYREERKHYGFRNSYTPY